MIGELESDLIMGEIVLMEFYLVLFMIRGYFRELREWWFEGTLLEFDYASNVWIGDASTDLFNAAVYVWILPERIG